MNTSNQISSVNTSLNKFNDGIWHKILLKLDLYQILELFKLDIHLKNRFQNSSYIYDWFFDKNKYNNSNNNQLIKTFNFNHKNILKYYINKSKNFNEFMKYYTSVDEILYVSSIIKSIFNIKINKQMNIMRYFIDLYNECYNIHTDLWKMDNYDYNVWFCKRFNFDIQIELGNLKIKSQIEPNKYKDAYNEKLTEFKKTTLYKFKKIINKNLFFYNHYTKLNEHIFSTINENLPTGLGGHPMRGFRLWVPEEESISLNNIKFNLFKTFEKYNFSKLNKKSINEIVYNWFSNLFFDTESDKIKSNKQILNKINYTIQKPLFKIPNNLYVPSDRTAYVHRTSVLDLKYNLNQDNNNWKLNDDIMFTNRNQFVNQNNEQNHENQNNEQNHENQNQTWSNDDKNEYIIGVNQLINDKQFLLGGMLYLISANINKNNFKNPLFLPYDYVVNEGFPNNINNSCKEYKVDNEIYYYHQNNDINLRDKIFISEKIKHLYLNNKLFKKLNKYYDGEYKKELIATKLINNSINFVEDQPLIKIRNDVIKFLFEKTSVRSFNSSWDYILRFSNLDPQFIIRNIDHFNLNEGYTFYLNTSKWLYTPFYLYDNDNVKITYQTVWKLMNTEKLLRYSPDDANIICHIISTIYTKDKQLPLYQIFDNKNRELNKEQVIEIIKFLKNSKINIPTEGGYLSVINNPVFKLNDPKDRQFIEDYILSDIKALRNIKIKSALRKKKSNEDAELKKEGLII